MNINLRNYKNKTALSSAKLKQNKTINLLINDNRFDYEESRLNFAFFLADYQPSQLFTNAKYLVVKIARVIKKPFIFQLKTNHLAYSKNF